MQVPARCAQERDGRGPQGRAACAAEAPGRLFCRDARRRGTGDGRSYRLAVELFPERPGTLPSAQLVGRLTRVKALPELSTTNEALSAAVDLTHRTLGRLRREPRATEFEGELRVLGTPVMLWVAQKEGLSVEQTLARAAALLVKVKKQFRQMPDAIVKKLLPLANGSWLEEGHAPSTRASLLRVLKPTTITFDQAARRAHVSFNCADVFGDHGVALTLTGSAIRDVRLQ